MIMVILTNGPVLLFSKRILDRTGRWEDLAVWPFFVTAACASAALAALLSRRGSLLKPDDAAGTITAPGSVFPRCGTRLATVAVACYSLSAVVSALWSVNSGNTLWRSLVYLGLALLAVVIAGFNASALQVMMTMVTTTTVAMSLLLVSLRPDIGIDINGDWRGLYTTRNSLAPLAAFGIIAGIRALLTSNDSQRRSTWRVVGGVLVAMSVTAMLGAGSRTAWLALFSAVGAATALAAYSLLLSRLGQAAGGGGRGGGG